MTMIHGLLPEDRSDDLDAVVRAGALAAVLRALADPTRLAILAHLEGGEHTVTQLREHLGLAQSTVSQHLGVLRDAGLVATHSHGRTSVNHLARPHQTRALLDAARVLLETLSPGAQAGSAVPRRVSAAARASSVMNCSSTSAAVSSSRKFKPSASHPCCWFAAGVAASRAVAISGVTERSPALAASSRTWRWCHPTRGSRDSRCGCPSASDVDRKRSPVGAR